MNMKSPVFKLIGIVHNELRFCGAMVSTMLTNFMVFRPSFVLKIDKLEAIRTVVFLMNIHKYLKFQYF